MTNSVSGDALTALEQTWRRRADHLEPPWASGTEYVIRLMADELAALIAAGRSAATTEQQLINDLYALFTSTPTEIAERFGESRCKDDHGRINYALEWIQDFVTESAPAPLPARKFPFAMNVEDHQPDCDIRTSGDGWDADCTCGAASKLSPQERAASKLWCEAAPRTI
jgi:hypothetical protein